MKKYIIYIKRFLKTSKLNRQVALYTFFWSMLIRFMIYFLPFKTYRKRLGKLQEESTQMLNLEEIAWAKHIKCIVEAVCNRTPWESKCLVQAIVCKQLLKKRSIESTIYLGILNDSQDQKITPHAWLKAGGIILTGRNGHKRYRIVNFYG